MNTKNQTTGGVPQISRILVAIDFSPQASHALEWARSLADAFGAKLILLHVIDVFGLALREEADKRMGELKALIPDAQIVIREASTRPAIVDATLELNCQMIVMGAHGHSELDELFWGSVADYVVRNSKVPVLTVRGN